MNRRHLSFLFVLIFAMSLRLGVVLWKSSDLTTDPDGYVAHARMIAERYGFSGPYSRQPTAFRPPGYSWLIAMMPGAVDFPERTVAMINVAAGVLTVLLTKLLAEQTGLSPPFAVTAAFLVAVDPLLLRYTVLPMTEVLSALVLTSSILAFQFYRRDYERIMFDSFSWKTVTATGAVAGLLFAVAAFVRPVAIVVCGVLSAGLAMQAMHQAFRRCRSVHGDDARSTTSLPVSIRLRAAATILLPGLFLAVGMSPWVIRNYSQFHRFIPATTHGGYTLALGNNADYYRDVVDGSSAVWDGHALNRWQQQMADTAKSQGIKTDSEPAMDDWMYQQAGQAIRRYPVSFLKACVLRWQRFWGVVSLENQVGPSWLRIGVAGWYTMLWILILAAAISSRTQAFRNSQFHTMELWLSVAGFLIMHTFYWTDARMRAPLMPVLSVLACLGSIPLLSRLRNLGLSTKKIR